VATGLTYMQARYYDPVVGRFMAVDPVRFSTGKTITFNRYAYASNNPVNRIDRDGETDIYIGGAGDSQTEIVKDYAAAQTSGGDRAIGYFNHGDKSGIVAFAKQNAGNGEPLNIIGHSYGASTAVSAAKALAKDGVTVDNLVGVDGVKKPFQRGALGEAESSVGKVVGVNSTGAGTRGDAVEGAGKALGAITTLGGGAPVAFKQGNADVSITTGANHADFSRAITTPGGDGLSAKDIIDNSYE
jgi:RHS repeat-associated protein